MFHLLFPAYSLLQLKYQSELAMHSYQHTQPSNIQVSFSPFRLNQLHLRLNDLMTFPSFHFLSLLTDFFNQLIKVYMRNLSIGSGNLAAGFALVLVPYLFFLVSRLDVDMLGHFEVVVCSSKINLWPLVYHYVRLQ